MRERAGNLHGRAQAKKEETGGGCATLYDGVGIVESKEIDVEFHAERSKRVQSSSKIYQNFLSLKGKSARSAAGGTGAKLARGSRRLDER